MHPNAIDQVLSAFKARGHEEYIGEAVNQLEHAAQSAELARQLYPDDADFIIAAFLHDYGHLCKPVKGEMDGFGSIDHETLGAEALRELGFSNKTALLVEGHVQAKRYLVSTDPLYYDGLSAASKITLMKQGGLLTPEEQQAFENDPLFELHIALRRIDDQAKVIGLAEPDLQWIIDLMNDLRNK